jgi:tetratricopeptide (TPR) repeat protein
LAGSPPFTTKDLEKAGMLEMLRVIREQEPSKPSTKLSTAEGLPTLAANRGTEPAKLTKLVRGELDWIVMKALEKDRSRRYETANGFAMDVQRYLADEPVLAGPPSSWYRFRKLARRNKVGLAFVALLLCFLVLVGGGVGWAMRDRAARRTILEQAVARALEDTETASQRGRLPEASAALKRAEELLAGGQCSDEFRERVGQWRADLNLVARLQEARMLGLGVNVVESHFSPELALPAYEAAFRDYGLQPTSVTAEEAAQRVRSRPPEIQLAVIAALDAWLDLTRLQQTKHQPERAWLRDILRAADADPLRQEMRAAIDAVYDAAFKGKKIELVFTLPASTDLDKQPPYTQLRFGMLLCTGGKIEQGLAVLRRAQQLHPGDFWINMELSEYAAKANPPRHEEAVRFASNCVAIQPDNPGARINLGGDLENQGKWEEAVAEYRQAIRLRPDYAKAHDALALLLGKQGKWEEAVVEYREAIRLRPDNPQAHYNLALVLMYQGKPDDAVVELRTAIRLKPEFPKAHNNLGAALQQRGKLDEAIAAHRQAIELKPDYAEAHTNLGRALAWQNKLDEALAECRLAIKHKPDCADAHNNLGFVFLKQQKLEEAISSYRTTLAVKPDHGAALQNLSSLLANGPDPKLRDPHQALDLAKKALHLDGTRKGWQILGWAYYRSGAWEDSIAALEKSIELNPGGADADQWLFLAMAHWQLGHKDKAREWYDRSVTWLENNKEVVEKQRATRLVVADVWTFRTEAAKLLGVPEKK